MEKYEGSVHYLKPLPYKIFDSLLGPTKDLANTNIELRNDQFEVILNSLFINISI